MSDLQKQTNIKFRVAIKTVFRYHGRTSIFLFKKNYPIHLGVACCIRCVMQHCFSLVSSVLRCQLTAVLRDSFVLLPYLCAQCNSETSHPTCSPHSPSLYIKLKLRSTSGNAEVGYICQPTWRVNGEVGKGFRQFSFMQIQFMTCKNIHLKLS